MKQNNRDSSPIVVFNSLQSEKSENNSKSVQCALNRNIEIFIKIIYLDIFFDIIFYSFLFLFN